MEIFFGRRAGDAINFLMGREEREKDERKKRKKEGGTEREREIEREREREREIKKETQKKPLLPARLSPLINTNS